MGKELFDRRFDNFLTRAIGDVLNPATQIVGAAAQRTENGLEDPTKRRRQKLLAKATIFMAEGANKIGNIYRRNRLAWS